MGKVGKEVRELYEVFPYPSRSHCSKRELEKYLRWVLPAFGEKSLDFFEGKTILDVGCGQGGTANFVQENGWGRVVGFDIEEESIAYAKERYKAVQFWVGDAAD